MIRERPIADQVRGLSKGFEHVSYVVRRAQELAEAGDWHELGASVASLGDWSIVLSREYVRVAEGHVDLFRLEQADPPTFSAIQRIFARVVL